MAEILLSPWNLGIDQVSDDTALPMGAVRDAVNVDFDRAGSLSSRPGFSLAQSLPGAHSLWTSATGDSYCMHGGDLCSVTYDGSTLTAVVIATLESDDPLSYQDLNGDVVCSNRSGIYRLRGVDLVRLGVEAPLSPVLAQSVTVGGLDVGRYGVAISYMRGTEESALSPATWIDVTAGNGLSIALPVPNDADVTLIRVYRTGANGDVFYYATNFPPSIGTVLVGAGPLGMQAKTRFLARMPGGQIIRLWRGRLLVARGKNLLISDPLNYGLFMPDTGFVQFPRRITMMQGVENGVFVGTADGVVFLSGQTPDTWDQRKTAGQAPVANTGREIDTSILGGEREYGGAYAALWLAGNGFVVGTSDGSLVQVQAKRIRLPDTAGAGAVAVFNRQIIATIN